MPLYDFLCKGCQKEFNTLASIEDKTESRIPCPDCGSTDLIPIYKAAPAFLRGDGKYRDCPNFSSCGMTCPYGCGG